MVGHQTSSSSSSVARACRRLLGALGQLLIISTAILGSAQVCRMDTIRDATYSDLGLDAATWGNIAVPRPNRGTFFLVDEGYITEWDYFTNNVTILVAPTFIDIDPTFLLHTTFDTVYYNFSYIYDVAFFEPQNTLVIASSDGSVYTLTLTAPRTVRRVLSNISSFGNIALNDHYVYVTDGSCVIRADIEIETESEEEDEDAVSVVAGICGNSTTFFPTDGTFNATTTVLPVINGIGWGVEIVPGGPMQVLTLWSGSRVFVVINGEITAEVGGTYPTEMYAAHSRGLDTVFFNDLGCRVQWLKTNVPFPPLSGEIGGVTPRISPPFCSLANGGAAAIAILPALGGFNASDFYALFVTGENIQVVRVLDCPPSAAFPSGSGEVVSVNGVSATLIVGLAVAGAVLVAGIAGAAAYALRSPSGSPDTSQAAAVADGAVAYATDDTAMRTVPAASGEPTSGQTRDVPGDAYAVRVVTESTDPGTVPAGDPAATSSLYASSVVDPNHFSVHLMDTIQRPAGPAERASAMKRDLTGTSTPTSVGGEAPVSITQVSALSQSDFRAFADGLGSDKARLLRLRAWSDAEMLRHNRRCEFVAGGQWTRGKVLGRGANGVVYTVVLPDGSAIAMKEVGLVGDPALIAEQLSGIRSELDLLGRLHHDNLVTYYGIVVDPDHLLVRLFMEIVTGGSLASMVMQMEEPLPESAAAMYVRQILRGLAFIHENGVIHRDLKCDNVLRDATTGAVKLADFGTAKAVGNAAGASRAAQTMIGTPYFMAPEILAAGTVEDAEMGYGAKADIWSLGITTAELLNRGEAPWPPFPTPAHAFLHIANPASRPVLPDHLSGNARDFIEACTRRDPRERPSALELLEHAWMQTILEEDSESPLDLLAQTDTGRGRSTSSRRRDSAPPGTVSSA